MLEMAILAATLLPISAGTETVSVVFVNHVGSRTLWVTTPAGRELVGSFEYGGTLTVLLAVPSEGDVRVSWRAGSLHGQFQINAQSPAYLQIDLWRMNYTGPLEATEYPGHRR
jgi:hypothetical protein